MKPASLSTRLGVSVALMGAVLVVLLTVLAYLTLTRELSNLATENLRSKLAQIEHKLAEDRITRQALNQQPHGLLDLVMGHENLRLAIYEPGRNAKPLLSINTQHRYPVQQISPLDQAHFQTSMDSSGQNLLVATATMKLSDGEPVIIELAFDRSGDEKLLRAYFRSTFGVLPMVLLLIGIGAWWIVKRGLKPLQHFSRVSSLVSTHDLTHRISTETLPLELKELAQGINVMLQRLDGGVQQLSQFSDDLAHELRSPISNLMGMAQVILSKTRDAEDYKSALECCTEELERVSRIVSDMLFLAQVSHPSSSLYLEEIRLEDEARRVMDLFQISAEEQQVEIHLSGEGVIEGDRLMVQRALSNLLSNAIRYTPPLHRISLTIAGTTEVTTLSVSNPGNGIPASHIPHLFERFYRVDASRSRAEGGTGLGLSIVESIMKLHRGRVTVASTPGIKTTFSLIFPQKTPENGT